MPWHHPYIRGNTRNDEGSPHGINIPRNALHHRVATYATTINVDCGPSFSRTDVIIDPRDFLRVALAGGEAERAIEREREKERRRGEVHIGILYNARHTVIHVAVSFH